MSNKKQNIDFLNRVKLIMEYNVLLTSSENINIVEQNNKKQQDYYDRYYGMAGNVPEWGSNAIPLNKREDLAKVDPEYAKFKAMMDKREAEKQRLANTYYQTVGPDGKIISSRSGLEVPENERRFQDIMAKVQSRRSVRYGKEVPDGFSPFDYDDYLDELTNIENQKKKLQQVKNKAVKTQGDLNYINNLERWLKVAPKQAYEKYHHEKFPNGITNDDLEFFEAQKKSLLDELASLEERTSRGPSFSSQYTRAPGWFLRGMASGESWMDPRVKKRYETLKKELNDLEFKFGYDGRTAFDKFMDSNWALPAQLALNLIAVIAGEMTGGLTWGLLMDAVFNLSIGAYQWSRDQQSEAMMSFVFAALPYMRNLHRLAGFPSKAITDSIAQKLLGKSLKNATEINSFLSTLTKEEAKVWKKIAYLHPSKITPEIEQLIKANKEIIKVTKTKLERLGSGAKRFLGDAAVDLTIAYTFSEVFDKVKEQLKKFGIPVKTQAELDSLKSWLQNGASPQEIEKVYDYTGYMLEENPELVQEMKNKGFNFKRFKTEIQMYKPSQNAINKKQQERKTNPRNLYQLED